MCTISTRYFAGAFHKRSLGFLVAAIIASQALITHVDAALSERSKVLKIAVVGDSLANDLGRGMEALTHNRRGVEIIKHTRFATGLVRTDYFDWQTSIRHFLQQSDPDIILVLIGGNDHQQIRTDQGRLDPFSKEWLAEYRRRVAAFMVPLRKERAKVYWIGLPAVRSPSMSRSYQIMNTVYRSEAKRHGFVYLSIWDNFLDRDGAYSSFGQSLEGVKRQLRESDGMHFTEAGRLSLAARIWRATGLR